MQARITEGYDPLNQGPGTAGPEREYRCEAVVNHVDRAKLWEMVEQAASRVPAWVYTMPSRARSAE